MSTTLRAVFIGVFAGAAIFFVPFLFRFLLIALFIGFIFRLFAGYHWRRRYYDYRPFGYPDQWEMEQQDLVSIDGNRYIAPVNRKGPENRFDVK